MRLSVVIVNYNTGDYLEKCLDSIAEKFGGLDYEVIVVDNASTDRSAHPARDKPGTILIENDSNTGFGAACNSGAKCSTGKAILFLNPDTKILSDNIISFLDSFDRDEKAGAIGCQNRLPDGSVQTSSYSFPSLFLVTAILTLSSK